MSVESSSVLAPSQISPRRVIFLFMPNVEILDAAGPIQVIHTAKRLGAAYELIFCGTQSTIDSAQGVAFGSLAPLPDCEMRDRIVVPGVMVDTDNPISVDLRVKEWLHRAFDAGAGIVSICTGAFVLGESGLLDRRRCTTHWSYTGLLRTLYPTANVVENTLYVRDHGVLTSAGVASGIDLALALVEEDYGPIFAAQVARHLVIYLRRNGTQPQQSVYLDYRTHLHQGIHQAQDFIVSHFTERISLAQIADAAQLSARSLNRLFKEMTGITPIQYQQYLRLELARTLMSDSQFSVEEIADKSGFQDARHFRRLWKTHFGNSPSASRPKAN